MLDTTRNTNYVYGSYDKKDLSHMSARELFDILQRQSEWSSNREIIQLVLKEKQELLLTLNHSDHIYSNELVDSIIFNNLPLKDNLEKLWVRDLKASLKSLLLDVTEQVLNMDKNVEKTEKYRYVIWLFAVLKINIEDPYDRKYIEALHEELSHEQDLPVSPLDDLVSLQFNRRVEKENSKQEMQSESVNTENKYNIWDDFEFNISSKILSEIPDRYYGKIKKLYDEWDRFKITKSMYPWSYFTQEDWDVNCFFVEVESVNNWKKYKVFVAKR